MRELGFRVWDKEDESYLHITKNKEDGVVGISPDGKKVLYLEDGEVIILKDVIIEQYTGLKDKNGKEIYEGDIVRRLDWEGEPKFEVEYYKAGFDPFQEGCYECMSPDGYDVEVIGNVHENPELLKGEE